MGHCCHLGVCHSQKANHNTDAEAGEEGGGTNQKEKGVVLKMQPRLLALSKRLVSNGDDGVVGEMSWESARDGGHL